MYVFLTALFLPVMGAPWDCLELNLSIQALKTCYRKNMLFLQGVKKFKVNVPSATQCPFRNAISVSYEIIIANDVNPLALFTLVFY